MACIRDQKGWAKVVVGTACGSIQFITVIREKKDGRVQFMNDQHYSIILEDKPTIHSVSVVQPTWQSKNNRDVINHSLLDFVVAVGQIRMDQH